MEPFKKAPKYVFLGLRLYTSISIESNIYKQKPIKMESQTCHKKLESKLKQCDECKTIFKTSYGLKRHLKNRKDILHNGRKFCNNAHLQRHLRTI